MSNPRLEDHLVGLELQLVELVENKQRAMVQGRVDDAADLDRQIAGLQLELASTADELSEEESDAVPSAELRAPKAVPSAA